MSWADCLMLIMSFCMSGANSNHSLKQQNQCRHEKLECIKRVTKGEIEIKEPSMKAEREVYLVNGCLDDSKFIPIVPPKPAPIPSASPGADAKGAKK